MSETPQPPQLSKLGEIEVLKNERLQREFSYGKLPGTCEELRALIREWEAGWQPRSQDLRFFTWHYDLIRRLEDVVRFSNGELYRVIPATRRGEAWGSIDLEPIYEFSPDGAGTLEVFQAAQIKVFPSPAAARSFFESSTDAVQVKSVQFPGILRGRLWGTYPCLLARRVSIAFSDGSDFEGDETLLISKQGFLALPDASRNKRE